MLYYNDDEGVFDNHYLMSVISLQFHLIPYAVYQYSSHSSYF